MTNPYESPTHCEAIPFRLPTKQIVSACRWGSITTGEW